MGEITSNSWASCSGDCRRNPDLRVGNRPHQGGALGYEEASYKVRVVSRHGWTTELEADVTNHRMEYATIVSIMVAMTIWDFVIGVLFGIVVSCECTRGVRAD